MDAGHKVSLSMPAAVVKRYQHIVPSDAAALSWEWHNMHKIVHRVAPDVVVVCNWPLLDLMDAKKVIVPIILDQHGPHLMERELQNYGDKEGNARRKINALRKADYFTCAGYRQHSYFQSWLRRAGWTEQERYERTAIIPVSMPPKLLQRNPRRELTFVYGGVFLPWQDPSLGLMILVEEMERRQKGQLRFFGGKHMVYPVDPGIFETLVMRLKQSSRVHIVGTLSHEELIAEYSQAHVAFDLMKRNPERELAFTTRTVEYLWCGLPVIYNNYAELSEYILKYDAGWAIDPEDQQAIRSVIDEIYEYPDHLVKKGQNAQRLVLERLNRDITIGPLAHFVSQASYRPMARRQGEGGIQLLWGEALVRYRHEGIGTLASAAGRYVARRLGEFINRDL